MACHVFPVPFLHLVADFAHVRSPIWLIQKCVDLDCVANCSCVVVVLHEYHWSSIITVIKVLTEIVSNWIVKPVLGFLLDHRLWRLISRAQDLLKQIRELTGAWLLSRGCHLQLLAHDVVVHVLIRLLLKQLIRS